MDLLRQYKTPGIIAPTDLKSCYDCICHSIVSLSMRRQGIRKSVVSCMLQLLQYLQHTVQCAFGNLDTTYGSDTREKPMQGVYQGNGARPIIWAVVSSALLQILHEDGYGTFFRTALSDKPIRIVGYAFVDDTDLIQTAKPGENFYDVYTQMQQAMDLWEGLIKNTGGALAVDKCRWWGVDFVWNDGQWRYKTQQELGRTLTAIDANDERQIIKQLDVLTAYETLGVWLAADGNHSKELKILKDTAKEWADRIRVPLLSESKSAQALHATIIKNWSTPSWL